MAKRRSRAKAYENQRLRRDFWDKLRDLAGALPFSEDLLAAYYCAFDRETPLKVRAVLFGTLAYFVMPADSIPDIVPVLGFTDDAAVLAAAIKYVAGHIQPEHRYAARSKLARL